MKMLTIALVAFALMLSPGCKSATVQGQGGAKLTLEKPGDLQLERGGMGKVAIKIHRVNLTEPVSISFEKLPGGVAVVDAEQKIVGDEGTYNLKASADADLVSGYVAQVTAKGPEGIAVTESLKITVEEKK